MNTRLLLELKGVLMMWRALSRGRFSVGKFVAGLVFCINGRFSVISKETFGQALEGFQSSRSLTFVQSSRFLNNSMTRCSAQQLPLADSDSLSRSTFWPKNGKSQLSITSNVSQAPAQDAGLSNAEISRYSRHLVLGDVGVDGQVALKKAKVLVIGAGGLGSPCLLYLAAAGVGTVGIVDADSVDESNLQRQIIHGTSTVGESKCLSSEKRILDINPFVNVKLYEKEFTKDTALDILKDDKWDVVVDGSDNFPTKYLINDACDIMGIPWVYSAILGFEGQVSVFNYGSDGASYRDLLPTPPPPGDVPSCAEGGVLGVLPGTCGCLQATEVIKILLKKNISGILSDRVLVFDALNMRFSEIGLKKDLERPKVTELINYQGFCAGPKSASSNTSAVPEAKSGHRTMDESEVLESTIGYEEAYHSINPEECLDKLSTGWSPWVLDVRLKTENKIVCLPFTDKVVPHRDVRLDAVPAEGDILVYCKAGVRGRKACKKLIALGVNGRRLYNLEGGIMKWRRDLDPSMPQY